jgi:hypothetical protein
VLGILDYNALSIVYPFFLAFICTSIEFNQKLSQIFYINSLELCSISIEGLIFSDFSINYKNF